MSCPRLSDLPPPPQGKHGWPWTEVSTPLSPLIANDRPWPRITIVTPSFNQARFLEQTLRSVLLQGYPNLEYLVLDGGSTDDSVEIIKKYSSWIDFWVSERDGGQSAAINRGLSMGSGEFATWINSDDMLYQNALCAHAARVGFSPKMVYAGVCAYMDADGNVLRMHRSRIQTLNDLLRIPTVWRRGGNIVQPEVLFPRALALEVGALDNENHRTMDYELWGKFLIAGAIFHNTDVPFGMFRQYPGQKTSDGPETTESVIATALNLLERADALSKERKKSIEDELRAYLAGYPERHWKRTGRLARIGLPRPVVTGLRSALKVLGIRS
jgi:glycosyltransferase involved in cell wall biosynthesis